MRVTTLALLNMCFANYALGPPGNETTLIIRWKLHDDKVSRIKRELRDDRPERARKSGAADWSCYLVRELAAFRNGNRITKSNVNDDRRLG